MQELYWFVWKENSDVDNVNEVTSLIPSEKNTVM